MVVTLISGTSTDCFILSFSMGYFTEYYGVDIKVLYAGLSTIPLNSSNPIKGGGVGGVLIYGYIYDYCYIGGGGYFVF